MVSFAIVELDDGLTVVPVQADQTPEDAATANAGILVDEGPYATYEDACEALYALDAADEDE